MANDFIIEGIFPIPIYSTYRNLGLNSTEKKEIKKIADHVHQHHKPEIEGWTSDLNLTMSANTYVLDASKLKKLKEFCEQHLKVYIKQTQVRQEADFYITQSWISVTRPGESHFPHRHPNSMISGVFYVSTIEEYKDRILFYNPNEKEEPIKIDPSPVCTYDVIDYQLILFPSWLAHGVEKNKSTKDRICISFNTFVKGTFGSVEERNRLVLQ